MKSELIGRIDVCQCCVLVHANGECCADHEGPDPLNEIGDGYSVTMGLSDDEHHETCTEADRESGSCECDHTEFSWRPCEGCGANLGGDRYAITLWRDEPVSATGGN